MDKRDLREKLLEERKNQEKKDIVKKGNAIKEKLFALEEYKKAKTVMFFVSFGKEVYTHNIVYEALKDGNKKVVVPKVIDFEIVPCHIENCFNMQRSSYGIQEPIDTKKVDKPEIDIVLVPGIGFDKKGNRIGFGKGYYDNFLKNTSALKIGLCMDFEIIEDIPSDEWDIPVDIIISEKQIIRVNK